MNAYLFLFGAIFFEVSGTLLLPLSENFKKAIPSGGMVLCYLVSFYLLTHAVKDLPLAVVYATWSGLGIALVSIFGPWVGGLLSGENYREARNISNPLERDCFIKRAVGFGESTFSRLSDLLP